MNACFLKGNSGILVKLNTLSKWVWSGVSLEMTTTCHHTASLYKNKVYSSLCTSLWRKASAKCPKCKYSPSLEHTVSLLRFGQYVGLFHFYLEHYHTSMGDDTCWLTDHDVRPKPLHARTHARTHTHTRTNISETLIFYPEKESIHMNSDDQII